MIFKHAALACHNRSSRGIFPETQWPPLSPFCATKASNSGRNEKKNARLRYHAVLLRLYHIFNTYYVYIMYIYIYMYLFIFNTYLAARI